MRMSNQGAAPGPRGATLALNAIMMPVLMGLVAVSVDIAVTATARDQLQTAADSAALAGARQLLSQARMQGTATVTSADIALAQSKAIAFATMPNNSVLGNSATLASSDVTVGYANNPTYGSFQLMTDPTSMTYANTVQVQPSVTTGTGGMVRGFFSGFQAAGVMKVTSAATVESIVGCRKIDNSTNANLLPIVLEQSMYNRMIAGTTTDQYTYQLPTNSVANGPDGISESVIFPVSAQNAGNWGTVNIGVSNNGTSTLSAQVQYGITPAQLATFPGGKIQLDSSLSPPSIQLGGNPGVSAGIKGALNSRIGNPVGIPIYDQSGGNGNNTWYRVVAFAAVRVVAVNFQGNPKYVIVQPLSPSEVHKDPTLIWGTVQTWTSGNQFRIALTHLEDAP